MKKYSSITRVNSRPTSPKRWQIGLIITVSAIAIGWFFPRLISSVSSIVLYPVQVVTQWYQHSEQTVPQFFRTHLELVQEIESLEQQLVTLSGTQLSIRRLLEENMQLRAAANFGTSSKRVVARVIAQPSRLTYDLLQIDKGTDQGLVVGAPVFIGLDTVVGVIIHTAPTYSFVELLTTPGFEATAYIVGPNIFAPIEGVGGGVARVRVPQGVPLREGDLVLLPSVESGVYGEVVRVENLPTQPEQFGYVTPPVPLHSIAYVSVIEGAPLPRSEVEIDAELRAAVRDYFKLDPSVFSFDLASSTAKSGSTTEAATSTPTLNTNW